MSATLSSLYEGWLCFSVAHASLSLMASQKLISSTQHREQSIIAVRSCLPIKHLHVCECKNDGCTCAYASVRQNGVKMEMFSPQNNRATEPNVNFLLTTTVHGLWYPYSGTLYQAILYVADL